MTDEGTWILDPRESVAGLMRRLVDKDRLPLETAYDALARDDWNEAEKLFESAEGSSDALPAKAVCLGFGLGVACHRRGRAYHFAQRNELMADSIRKAIACFERVLESWPAADAWLMLALALKYEFWLVHVWGRGYEDRKEQAAQTVQVIDRMIEAFEEASALNADYRSELLNIHLGSFEETRSRCRALLGK